MLGHSGSVPEINCAKTGLKIALNCVRVKIKEALNRAQCRTCEHEMFILRSVFVERRKVGAVCEKVAQYHIFIGKRIDKLRIAYGFLNLSRKTVYFKEQHSLMHIFVHTAVVVAHNPQCLDRTLFRVGEFLKYEPHRPVEVSRLRKCLCYHDKLRIIGTCGARTAAKLYYIVIFAALHIAPCKSHEGIAVAREVEHFLSECKHYFFSSSTEMMLRSSASVKSYSLLQK